MALTGLRVMSAPSNSIEPLAQRTSPARVLRRVLLPCPFGPKTATSSPSPTSIATSCRTWYSP